MKFTVITPSFNQLPYLKRCIASVRDQIAPQAQRSDVGSQRSDVLISDLRSLISGGGSPIRVHHHVQDAFSTDGTVDWLRQYDEEIRGQRSENGDQRSEDRSQKSGPNNQYPITNNYRFTWSSERDAGMYDALNKGISFALQKRVDECQLVVDKDSLSDQQRTTGSCDDGIVAWLNCDEQYLPGALQNVLRGFEKHSEADFIYGDALLVDAQGQLLTYRKNPPLRRAYVLADHLYTQSAAMFFCSQIFLSGLRFDPVWKAVGDCDLVVRALKAGFRPVQMRVYLAACTMTGSNLSRKQSGVEELQVFRRTTSKHCRLGRPVWNLLRYSEKFLRGGYRQSVPLKYELYPEGSNVRKEFIAHKAAARFSWGIYE
jgi:glycosyltransferase involved in cell wall biosynthesis